MNLSASSRASLDHCLQSLAAGRNAIRPAKDLALAVEGVQKRFGNGQAALVTQDRVEAAVVALTRSPEFGRRQLFVLAHAFAQPVRALHGRTVLQDDIGTLLLTHWEDQARDRRLKSSQWRGLFRSYMQAGHSEASQRLRELLVKSLPSLGSGRASPPSWLAAISRHEGLLGSTPCAPYIEELIDGSTTLLDDLRQETGLPDASWFWVDLRETALAQVETLSDTKFKARLDHLVSLPGRIPHSRDEILSALISRYSRCADRGPHRQLLSFALEEWGSPQLKSNRLWGYVTDDARQMVCGWLAQEDLEDFYRLCKGTRQVDDRRLKFWLRFKEQMGYTQILLGGQLRYSRDADIRDFVKKKKGRIGDLTSGPATNNAILMQIGGWLFIEFSETGNACYAYPIGEAAIELGRKSYSISQLKPSGRSVKRLLHMDGYETWEQKFQASLYDLGVQPDSTGTRANPGVMRDFAQSRGRDPALANPTATTRPAGTAAQDEVGDALLARLTELNVRIVDNRAKGGAIWAYPNGSTFPYAELRALGMKFKSDNQGFYWP